MQKISELEKDKRKLLRTI